MDSETINKNLSDIMIESEEDEELQPTMDQGSEWKIVDTVQRKASVKMFLSKYSVPTTNSFEVLSQQDTSEMEAVEQQPRASTSSAPNSTKPNTPSAKKKAKKPPPIVIHSKVDKHKQFCEAIDEEIKNVM